MKQIHIALVGGQPIPVYIGIKDNGMANAVVLVCSVQSMVEAERIKAQFPKRNIIVKQCSPIDIVEINCVAEQLLEEYHEHSILMNLTGGTKLWCLSFFRVFAQHPHCQFIYVDQNNTVTDILTNVRHQRSIDMNTQLQLYGTPVTSMRHISEYTENDLRVMNSVANVFKYNAKEFMTLTRAGESESRTGKGSVMSCDYAQNIIMMQLLGKDGRCRSFRFQSEHVFDIVLKAGWFELKVARDISSVPAVKDVWLNCKFSDAEGNAKNEVDIIADFGHRLMFVECKTMIYDTTDIDKFRSALRNFSGTSTLGLFVTNNRPNENSRSSYHRAMEKCADNGILTFNYALWRDAPNPETSLRGVIETNIFGQNKR